MWWDKSWGRQRGEAWMGRLGSTQQRTTVLRAMWRPGICDSDGRDVGFVVYVPAQYRFPLARTMTFPNELLCHHLLGDKHYSKSVGEGQMITICPVQSGKRNRRDLRLAKPTKYAFSHPHPPFKQGLFLLTRPCHAVFNGIKAR